MEIEMRMDSKFDLKTPRLTLGRSLGRFATKPLVFLGLLAISFGGLQLKSSCAAQQSSTTSDPRQTPAHWRPAFGSLNKAAVPSEDVGNGNELRSNSQGNPTTGTASANAAMGGASQGFNNRDQSNTGNSNAGDPNASQSGIRPGFNLAPNNLNQPNNRNANRTPQPDTTFTADQITEPGVTRVTKTLDKLPNSAGQVWREYDISPYTSRITTSEDPQKAVTEWILRETGTEMWFHQPLGILNAEKDRLLVYHTPEIHGIVKGIVDRFNRTRGQVQNVDVNLVTVEKPNWRAQSYTMLQPIEVNSPGVEAWMISKENAAILLGQLSRRGDFKQHSGGRLANHDGQSFVLEKTRPVQFVRSLRWVPNQTPNYQPQMTKVDEGYRLELSCLSALDNQTIEAVIKCDVDQVEKLNTVKVSVPAPGGGAQQMNLQIPQLVSWRLHERFRWPNDQVLLLSCGVVATPEPQTGGGLKIPGLSQKSKRADALLFVEYRGPSNGPMVPQSADRLAPIRQR